MAVHFYADSRGNGNQFDGNVVWKNILEKPKLVTHIQNVEEKLIIYYEDGTSEELKVGLKGISQVQPLMYYGTNTKNEIGFHFIPIDGNGNEHDDGIEQRVILNAEQNKVYFVESKNDMSNGKSIVQAYKFIQGAQDIIHTIKAFNNGEKDNFFYDKINILFDEGFTICKEFNLEVTRRDGLFVSEVINKNDFLTIKEIREGA